jgi:hypothetical protein
MGEYRVRAIKRNRGLAVQNRSAIVENFVGLRGIGSEVSYLESHRGPWARGISEVIPNARVENFFVPRGTERGAGGQIFEHFDQKHPDENSRSGSSENPMFHVEHIVHRSTWNNLRVERPWETLNKSSL